MGIPVFCICILCLYFVFVAGQLFTSVKPFTCTHHYFQLTLYTCVLYLYFVFVFCICGRPIIHLGQTIHMHTPLLSTHFIYLYFVFVFCVCILYLWPANYSPRSNHSHAHTTTFLILTT